MAISDVKDWAESVLGASTYVYVYGMWQESAATHGTLYCVIQANGGSAPAVDTRRPRYRFILLGRRGQGADSQRVLADAEALMQAAMNGILPCGAANIRATTEVTGPAFTTEGRAWVEIEFEVIQ